MEATYKKTVKATINALSQGFRVERTADVPSNHRIPGMLFVVMGPNITGGPGEGSYGSGKTEQEAIDNAAAIQRTL